MKKFVVAYANVFGDYLKIDFIEAECERDAAIEYLGLTEHPMRLSLPTMEEIYSYASDQDSFIEVKEVPN